MELFLGKWLTNPLSAYNINSVRSNGAGAISTTAVNRTSNRHTVSQRAARIWWEGGGADPVNIPCEPRTERCLPVGSAGCPRYRTHECRISFDVRNGSGTAEVCAFVSYRGQGRFCLKLLRELIRYEFK